MAEQSFLAKLGLRLGVVGSAAALAIAAPIANATYDTTAGTAANRTGWYFDQTAAAEKIGMIVGGQTGPIFTRNGSVVDAAFTGAVTIGNGTAASNLIINGAAGTSRNVTYQTAGVLRWQVGANSTAEGGADAGSDYAITAYSDTGVLVDVPMVITRAAGGLISLVRSLTINTGATGSQFNVASNAGTIRAFNFLTGTSLRWAQIATSTAESGSNAGSDWALQAYSDTAVLIDTPIAITRAALGVITLSRPVSNTAGTLTGSQVTWTSSATWNNGATTFTGWLLNVTDTASVAGSFLIDLQMSGVSRFNIGKAGKLVSSIVDTDLLGSAAWAFNRTSTLTGNVTDGIVHGMSAVVNGAFTVTRFNYLALNQITGTSTITDGCVFRFNANVGTHKALDNGTTKTSPGTVSAWMKHNVQGTIYFQPLYTSKTS